MRGALVAVSTALVILGASILPFLTPAFVRFEQDRAGAPAFTGYTPREMDEVTGWLLGDLLLWQGDFDHTLEGVRVLKQPEIDHMLDVRRVFAGLFAFVAASAVVLVVAFGRARGAARGPAGELRAADPRAATWRAVATGAGGLAVAIAAAGVAVLVAFDAAFELFHQLFFTRGTYTFDPRTDKLVQLFPYQFWSETSIAVGAVVLVVAVATWRFARRRGATTEGAAPAAGTGT